MKSLRPLGEAFKHNKKDVRPRNFLALKLQRRQSLGLPNQTIGTMTATVGSENERASSELSDTVIQSEVKKKWTSYIWDTLDKSPEERRLLFKLDTALLTFASLG